MSSIFSFSKKVWQFTVPLGLSFQLSHVVAQNSQFSHGTLQFRILSQSFTFKIWELPCLCRKRKTFCKGWITRSWYDKYDHIWSCITVYHSLLWIFRCFSGAFCWDHAFHWSLRMVSNEQNKSESKMPSFSLAASSSRRKVWRGSKCDRACWAFFAFSTWWCFKQRNMRMAKPNLIEFDWSKTLSFLASTLSLMPDRPLLRSCR